VEIQKNISSSFENDQEVFVIDTKFAVSSSQFHPSIEIQLLPSERISEQFIFSAIILQKSPDYQNLNGIAIYSSQLDTLQPFSPG